ncbi:YcxB family protein [Alkaliphilus transvaalensis]|uniref:YcxB family protein n=1 Tax=Alkaliphilus transvaalensis TaxID=114628 RepID=UPI00047B9643|nr:YcxB family protein [Alkaliphilus transvaalensis]
MKYIFNYRTTAFDLWQLSMYGIYGSMVGVCNLVFTVAMVLLSGRFWGEANSFIKVLLIMGISLFTVIQPVAIYRRGKKQVSTIHHDTEIVFNDYGVQVKSGGQNSHLEWSAIKGVSKKPTMIIVFSSNKHGFILTNKVLGKEKEALYNYILSKTQK